MHPPDCPSWEYESHPQRQTIASSVSDILVGLASGSIAKKPISAEKAREYSLKHLYGISVADYNWLFMKQGGLCAICKKPPIKGRGKKLHVDHFHSGSKLTDKVTVRGLLCGACNSALGLFFEDLDTIKNALVYLSRHRDRLIYESEEWQDAVNSDIRLDRDLDLG